MKKLVLVLTIVLHSCQTKGHLGKGEHYFNQKPDEIIWYQVYGPSIDLMNLFLVKNMDKDLKKLQESCTGIHLPFVIGKVAVNSNEQFWSTIFKRPEAPASCLKTELEPIWKTAGGSYSVAILENFVKAKDSVRALENCSSGSSFLNNLNYYSRGGVFNQDKSCVDGRCFDSLAEYFNSIYDEHQARSVKSLFIVRDHEFLSRIDSVSNSNKVFSRMDAVFRFYEKLAKKAESGRKVLLVMSFMGTQKIDNLRSIKSNRSISVRQSDSREGFSFFKGAGAEKFCGLSYLYDISNKFLGE